MRQPTPVAELMRWHNAALAGMTPPVCEDDPQMGWYKTRMVQGGPYIPARIWIERDIDPETGELTRDETMLCEIGGERRDPYQLWISLAGSPISQDEYDALCALHEDMAAMAATHVPLDLSQHIIRP